MGPCQTEFPVLVYCPTAWPQVVSVKKVVRSLLEEEDSKGKDSGEGLGWEALKSVWYIILNSILNLENRAGTKEEYFFEQKHKTVQQKSL